MSWHCSFPFILEMEYAVGCEGDGEEQKKRRIWKICMNLLSLLGLVEGFSEQGFLDSAQCVQLKSIRIEGKSSFAGRRKATWNPFPCGTTSERSMVQHGVEKWISSLLDSLANPSALRGNSKENPTIETCGRKPSESFAKYDPDSRSWKTCRASKQKSTSERSWPISPRAGMVCGGTVYELPTAAPHICATGSGYLPTPVKADARSTRNSTANRKKIPPTGIHAGNTLTDAVVPHGGKLNPTWVEWLIGWPLNWTSLEAMARDDFDDWKRRTEAGSGDLVDGRGRPLRSLWWEVDPSEASQGSEPAEQRGGEHRDPLPEVPHGGAHEGGRLGQGADARRQSVSGLRDDVPTTASDQKVVRKARVPSGIREAVSRTTLATQHRVDRLGAIGDGQVPTVVVRAWYILTSPTLRYIITQ